MNLTENAQRRLRETMPLEDVLPTRMPTYVNSLSYLFGASILSALALLVLTGVVLSIFGAEWWHVSHVGRFVNSLHFWGVQAFFAMLIAHMITKFLMAAWRDWYRGQPPVGVGR